MPDTNEVEIQHEGPVTIIKINRPLVRNAINKSTALALKDAWLAFEADENAYVGILAGSDEVFCAGPICTILMSYLQILRVRQVH